MYLSVGLTWSPADLLPVEGVQAFSRQCCLLSCRALPLNRQYYIIRGTAYKRLQRTVGCDNHGPRSKDNNGFVVNAGLIRDPWHRGYCGVPCPGRSDRQRWQPASILHRRGFREQGDLLPSIMLLSGETGAGRERGKHWRFIKQRADLFGVMAARLQIWFQIMFQYMQWQPGFIHTQPNPLP